jgi:anti-sigma factor RsiW
MLPAGCHAFGADLGPFLDGELDGVRMLRMSRHLETCEACTSALADMRLIGGTLRDMAPADPPLAVFDGLASSMVSRTRAESAVSWRSTLSRGLDDWHWAIVGGGAIAATFVSTSLLSVILAFGPAPQREDSLSALATDLSSPAGFLFAFASPTGEAGQDVQMLQVENGRPAAPRLVSDLVAPRSHASASEAELVDRFQRIVTQGGRVLALESLGPEQRASAEALLTEITRLRSRDTEPPARSFDVYELRLFTSTSVTAKRS